MKNNLGKFLVLGFVIVLLAIAGILNSCAVPTDTNVINSSDFEGKAMKLVGQDSESGIGVYKVVDGSTVCYVAVNMLRYYEASIFCK